MFIDLDGSLTGPFTSLQSTSILPPLTLTPNRPTLKLSGCYETGLSWDDSLLCDNTQKLKAILITNMDPWNFFKATRIKVIRLTTPEEDISSNPESDFSVEEEVEIMNTDLPNSWAMPFALGYYYNVHWRHGIDFSHMSIAPSRLFSQNENGVVLRFNYTDTRELFEIGKWYEGQLQNPYIEDKLSLIDPATCENGDYYNDKINQYLYVCVSGKNKEITEWIDVNGIRCVEDTCPVEGVVEDVEREVFTRLWSNASQWPNGILPQAGDNVTINYEWNMELDVTPPVLNYLKIQGNL